MYKLIHNHQPSAVLGYIPRHDKHIKGGIDAYTEDGMHFGSIAIGDHNSKINGYLSYGYCIVYELNVLTLSPFL